MTGVSDVGQLLAIIATEASEHPYEGSETQKAAWDEIKRRFDALAAELETAREALIRCASDLVAAEKRVAELEADARLALEGLPDPMHPRFRRDECERLVSSQVLIANMAGEDDPGNVEASRAALIEETAP